MQAYGNTCAVTGCDAIEALEASHIVPYLGPDTDRTSNGMLLRADVHILFDLGLIAIDTANMSVILSPRLIDTLYSRLAGRPISLPGAPGQAPSKEALNHHRAWSGL